MGKSYKKNPVVKYIISITKEQASRILRRINKVRINQGKDPLQKYEVVNPYDLHDYIFTNWPGERRYDVMYDDKIRQK